MLHFSTGVYKGAFHLTTIRAKDRVTDQQTVVLQSPTFVIQGPQASFLASGGFDEQKLFVGLYDADTGKRLRVAGDPGGPQMQRILWDTSNLKGRSCFLRIVDQHTGPWGHLTFDDFSVEGSPSPF